LILKKKKRRTTGPSLSIRNRVIVWGIDRTRDLRLFPAYCQCVIMLCVCALVPWHSPRSSNLLCRQ
jgi:hypothetical protein